MNKFERWSGSLRDKASRYEHSIPLDQRIYPSLDDICNEMDAFVNGFNSGRVSK
jgi:hypothetical protein